MNDESVELRKSPINNVSAELPKDLKTWINAEKTIPIPIMNDNKERDAKDDSNVTFCNDCVFNERTREKYEKTNILNDRPSYPEVANKQYVRSLIYVQVVCRQILVERMNLSFFRYKK